MIKVYGVRCYARRLGASGCNAHAKAQAALGPGLRRTSHAIVQPLRPPFLSFSLPPRQAEPQEILCNAMRVSDLGSLFVLFEGFG